MSSVELFLFMLRKKKPLICTYQSMLEWLKWQVVDSGIVESEMQQLATKFNKNDN